MRANPEADLERFLAEDIGCGDITSELLAGRNVSARIVSRELGIVAGAEFAKRIFEMRGSSACIVVGDGCAVGLGSTILEVAGPAPAVLSCERTALNLLSRMSSIATQTHDLVKLVGSTGVEIMATRKTAPGLRYFDKLAVKIGGGLEHRRALDEAILIKDNHIASGGPLEEIVSRAKATGRKVEVEVESAEDALAAAVSGADVIMLDNFSPEGAAEAVHTLEKRGLRNLVKIEASGGIDARNVALYAKAGVDMISVGALTNSVRGMDVSMEVESSEYSGI